MSAPQKRGTPAMSQATLIGNITKGNQNSGPKKVSPKSLLQSASAAPRSPTPSVPAPLKTTEQQPDTTHGAEKQIKFAPVNSIHVHRARTVNRPQGRFSFPDGHQTALAADSSATTRAGPQHMSNLKRPLITAPVNPFEDNVSAAGDTRAPPPKKAKKSGTEKRGVMSIRSILNGESDDDEENEEEEEHNSIGENEDEKRPRGAVSIGDVIRSSVGGPPPDLESKETTPLASDALFTASASPAPTSTSESDSASSEESIIPVETRTRLSRDKKGKGKANANQHQQKEWLSTSTIPGAYCLEVYLCDERQRKYEEALLEVLGDLELPIAM